ncbi:TraR/DksA C4-type zinc finger protein, partial [Listeria monocytogenes]|nr:TraR/DksA C4-type zinc finger protein [Listeria monocytogenes]
EALERLARGDYGWCQETGEPIGLRRLLLRPPATLCIEAKERQEKRERHVRHN